MTTPATVSLPGRGIKPLVSLRAHFHVALAVFVLALLAGIPIIYVKGKVYYAATAVVQVAPRYMKNLRDDGELDFPSNTQYREFLEQQTRSVNRYDIVRDALASLGDKAQSWRKPGDSERRSVDILRESLIVRTVPDTYMIEIQLQSADKEALADVVNAVVRTYVERMRSERVFGSDVRVRSLEAREKDIVEIIRDKTEKRTAIALQLGIGAFTGKEENPYDRVLADLRSAHAESRNKRFEAESQQKAFESTGETDIKTRSIQEAVLIDPGLSNLKANLFKRRADLLTQLSGLQPAHPAYAEASGELKRIDAEISAQTSKLTGQVHESVRTRYMTGVDQSRRIESNIKNDLDELSRKGSAFAALYNQAMTLTYDIDQQRKELDTVRERLNHFASEQNSFGFVRLVTPALPPEMPFGMGKRKIALLVLAVALLLMLSVPIGIDLLDRRIQTVNDAENVMGVPALGWMVERTDAASQLYGEDLLRRMAGSLIKERQRQGTQVFAFSSIKPAGGASELVLSLGKTLDALGYRTLAVEANAFRPDARYAGASTGLAERLRSEYPATECITRATDTLPARVCVGDTGGRNHLDRLDRIAEVARGWTEQFSFVLVDLPPLLLSADAEIMARNLEHLIVVVEANGIVTGELRRASRQLEKLDPASMGVVVNRVRPFDGGGYLQGAMVEYLSGHKLREYFTTSSWQLGLLAGWIRMQRRFSTLGAFGKRFFSFPRDTGLSKRVPDPTSSSGTRPAAASARSRARAIPGRRALGYTVALLILLLVAAFVASRHSITWAAGNADPGVAEASEQLQSRPLATPAPPSSRALTKPASSQATPLALKIDSTLPLPKPRPRS